MRWDARIRRQCSCEYCRPEAAEPAGVLANCGAPPPLRCASARSTRAFFAPVVGDTAFTPAGGYAYGLQPSSLPTCQRAIEMIMFAQRIASRPGTLARLARLTSQLAGGSDVLLSVVGGGRQLLLGSAGLPAAAALLVSYAFAKRVAATRRPLVIGDARADVRVWNLPVVRDGTVRAYLGLPIVGSDGAVLGALSVVDQRSRVWAFAQLQRLRGVAALVVTHLELCSGVGERTRVKAKGVHNRSHA